MPKSVDRGYRVLAANYLQKQAKQLAAQLEGVRASEDVECVHRARVASRRLRTATRMFRDCFPRKRLQRWRKQIRLVTTGLGEARDKDVQVEFLCTTLENVTEKACLPGIARVLVEAEQQRERVQPQTIQAVRRLEASGVLREIRKVAKRLLVRKAGRPLGVQSPAAFRQTKKHILKNLQRLLSYQDSLRTPYDRESHHAMRIAAKRLRYTLEISAPVYCGQLREIIDAVKKVQTLLGEVHDCDVWVDHLGDSAERHRKAIVKRFGHAGPFARLQVGIEYLRQERRQRRQAAFQQLVDFWRELCRQGTWVRLVDTVRTCRKSPAKPRQSAEAPSDGSHKSATRGDGPDGRPLQPDLPRRARSGRGRSTAHHRQRTTEQDTPS